MGCRETHNLFRKVGWQVILRGIRQKGKPTWGWKTVLEDTFGILICKLVGHDAYQSDWGYGPEWACKRCHKWLPTPPPQA